MKLHNRKNLNNAYSKPLHVLFRKEFFLFFQNKNDDLTATVRKSQKGFYAYLRGSKSVGHHITPHDFLLRQKNQKKLVLAKAGSMENTKRRYTQPHHKSLQMYLKHWRTWAYTGLPSKSVLGFDPGIHSVDDITRSLVDKGTRSRENTKFTEITKPAKTLCVLLAEQP